MANKLYDENAFISMASAIREKTGGSRTYKVGDMAGAILEINADTAKGIIEGTCSVAEYSDVTMIGTSAFYMCSALEAVSFPQCTTIGGGAFYGCSALAAASFPACASIGSYAFGYCSTLTTLYLNGVTSVTSLPYSDAFSMCTKLTSIYVPASLVAGFKSATNWTYFSDKIVAWEG